MATIDDITRVKIADLTPYEKNARVHTDEQVDQIAASIKEFGFLNPILIDKDGNIIAGHGRVMAAERLGMEDVPALYIEGLTEAQRRAYILADNRLTELGGWDVATLKEELQALDLDGFDIELTGFSLEKKAGPAADQEKAKTTLRERFIIPPFSVLDARQAVWQQRKRAWKDLGIKSEIGRGADNDNSENGLIWAASHQPPKAYEQKNEYEKIVGKTISWDDFFFLFPEYATYNGTSIFDPVLCELIYRWFSKDGDKILDPFAGGSVRGITAALLGREYTGVDLSARQIAANEQNWEEVPHEIISGEGDAQRPNWINGDSANIKTLAPGRYNLIFTCPPYADLEKYSDDPADLSNMPYPQFIATYRDIIKAAVEMLEENSFVVFVVGDVRDRRGIYRGFVNDTIDALRDAGLEYYNEAVLVTNTGAIATTAGSQFDTSRKLSKNHQNVLVFYNGTEKDLGKIRLDNPEEEEADAAAVFADNDQHFIKAHDKALVFVKGSAPESVKRLGPINAATNDSFIVDIG